VITLDALETLDQRDTTIQHSQMHVNLIEVLFLDIYSNCDITSYFQKLFSITL